MIIELGEKLKALRIENHLRQDQVARLVNVEKSSISMYETGVRQPSYDWQMFSMFLRTICWGARITAPLIYLA